MKIYFVTCCGSYNSHAMWTIASIYNVVDKIIVINGGYDLDNFDINEDNIPLEREKKQLKDIDINNKIIQIKPNWKCQLSDKKRDELRGRNITLAFQYGYQDGADWILKADCDQIFTEDLRREYLEELTYHKDYTGFIFAQYADWYRDFEHVDGLPDDFCNDGSVFFKAHKTAWSVGQGSPVIGDQHHIYDEELRTHHLRRVAPPDLDEFKYHYYRELYHLVGPNSIMELPINRQTGKQLTIEELKDQARQKAQAIMNRKASHISEIHDQRCPRKKPLVIEMGPQEYIKQGFPKDEN